MEKNISKALFEFSKVCPKVNLDGQVKYGNTEFRYATLGNIIDKIRPHLINCGLFFTQQMDGDGNLMTCIIHESGEQICSSYLIPNFSDPKLLGAYITYLKRYQLSAILGIVADEDNDMPSEKMQPKLMELEMLSNTQKIGLVDHFKRGKSASDVIKSLGVKWNVSDEAKKEIKDLYNQWENTAS